MGDASAVRDWEGQVEDLYLTAKAIKKVNDDNEGQVADLGSAITALTKELEAERKALVEPWRVRIDEINAVFAPLRGRLAEALDYLKMLIADWKLAQIKAREAEQKRIDEERRKLEAERRRAEAMGVEPPPQPAVRAVAPPPPANVARGSFGKAIGKKIWKAELVDMTKLCQAVIDGKVPPSVLKFDRSAAISLARGGMEFEAEAVGIRAWQEETQAFS